MAALVDAGPVYAALNADEVEHEVCSELLTSHPGPLLLPILVVSEVAHLVARSRHPEAEIRFLGDVARGAFIPEHVRASDWLRIAELVGRYRDLDLGTVDASIVAAAERLGITEVVTLDRRDFGAVRPSHAPAFDLLP